MKEIPASFIDDLRARIPLSAVVKSRVSWDRNKSKPQRGDFWALCPFHQEKSPSFHVDDRRGFYHCFGCRASGDHISFLREQEGLSFVEAVEKLAAMAGVESPHVGGREQGRTAEALEWNEAAVRFYRDALGSPAGSEARRYLREKRGVSDETIDAFEIGYAPEDGWALLKMLKEAGASWEDAVDAGLATWKEGEKAPYAVFRNRIVFPIRDTRGRCIGFGGRAMSAQTRAKYLNTPATSWFDKSRVLYNQARGRAGAARGRQLLVVEGYMDVIGLSQAGFEAVVAPLGAAITESHLQLLWQMNAEPVVALDGDRAGLEGALRTADMALPFLEPGKSLRFAVMPSGMDPDELVRLRGPDSLRRAIEGSLPMAEMLWRRETGGERLDSPERRAALDERLRSVLERIAHRELRDHYRMEFARRRARLFEDHAAVEAGGKRAEQNNLRRRLLVGMTSTSIRAKTLATFPVSRSAGPE